MILKQAHGNTWYLESTLLIPLYRLNKTDCILIDTGWHTQRQELDAALEEYHLNPVAVLGTHTHVDHSGNSGYLMKKYNIPVAMSVGEAGMGYTTLNLKALYHTWSPKGVVTDPRFGDMVFQPDILIPADQKQITLCGVTFEILHTPGHTPDHVSYVTPDDVLCIGDAVLTESEITEAKLPYFFSVQDALASMEIVANAKHTGYIAVHKGYYEDIRSQAELCMREVKDRCQKILNIIDHPMVYSEIHQKVCKEMTVRSQRVTRYLLFERNIQSVLDYLLDIERIELQVKDSVLYYCPKNS